MTREMEMWIKKKAHTDVEYQGAHGECHERLKGENKEEREEERACDTKSTSLSVMTDMCQSK